MKASTAKSDGSMNLMSFCDNNKNSPIKPTASFLESIVAMQKSNGSWSSIEVLQFIGISQSKFDSLKQYFGLDDLLLTILVVGYLTKHHNKP
jgi:hypothetical protein